MNTKISSGLNFKKLISATFSNSETPKKIFAASSAIALFFLAFKVPLDPDMFWHLKTGELIWQYKIIPHINWYSYTMSDFPWIDHEWLSEILMFALKNTFGLMGLVIFFAAITAFIFAWIIPKIARDIRTSKYPFYTSFILSILGAITSSFVFGARPQIFSLLGVALTLYAIKEYQIHNDSKIVYLLPLMFLLWVNMHGGFIMGIVLLGIYLIIDKNLGSPAKRHPEADWIKLYRPLTPEAWKKLSYIFLLSISATLVNPYGARIYLEIFNTFTDSYGHSMILEWVSMNFQSASGIIFGFYLVFIFIVYSIIKKVDIFSFVILPFLLFYSLQSVRNIPVFVIASLPVLTRSLEDLEETFSSIMQKKLITAALCVMLVIYPPIINGTQNAVKAIYDKKELYKQGNYPNQEALAFLKNYQAKNPGNMLNDYLWGGYLIADSDWQMVNGRIEGNSKVFIDGRMSFWRTPKEHILKDYADLARLEDSTTELLDKYRIKIIFFQKDSILSHGIAFNNKWKKIYDDGLAVIYEKE